MELSMQTIGMSRINMAMQSRTAIWAFRLMSASFLVSVCSLYFFPHLLYGEKYKNIQISLWCSMVIQTRLPLMGDPEPTEWELTLFPVPLAVTGRNRSVRCI